MPNSSRKVLAGASCYDDYEYQVTQKRLNDLRPFLGSPTWERRGVALYTADCLDAMRDIPSALVELTVTSPPYNIGKEYEVARPINDYLDWTNEWIGQVHRVTSQRGAFWLNLGYISIPERGRAVPLTYLVWPKLPFYLVQEVVWNYGAGVASRRMFSPRNEKWLWLVKDPENYTFNLDSVRDPNVKYPNQRKNGRLRVNPLGKNPTDVWMIPKVTTGAGRTGRRASVERTRHPAQFPLAVVRRILRACSDEGSLVMDPFMGSGSTAVAAMLEKRSCIGFELRPDYVSIATDRLEKVHSMMQHEQLTLLSESELEYQLEKID